MRQLIRNGCCCYHKGTYFQANHNDAQIAKTKADVVVATTKVRIFKQITTEGEKVKFHNCCCCYHKGTYFQANHNIVLILLLVTVVVVATTKVRIFEQITTRAKEKWDLTKLLLLPQRYVFSSKSQLDSGDKNVGYGCCCYHKGTYFQANHNGSVLSGILGIVVVATTKVRIFKQITTGGQILVQLICCCCYHKGTYFQANHNVLVWHQLKQRVVVATTKVRIFKQITTWCSDKQESYQLLLLPQRYVFSSKSQQN